ncbi:MAG: hypothetical protein ACXWUG_28090 [Polyangiales bacterium]
MPRLGGAVLVTILLGCSSDGSLGSTDNCPTSVPKVDDGCNIGDKQCYFCAASTHCWCFDHAWRCESYTCPK